MFRKIYKYTFSEKREIFWGNTRAIVVALVLLLVIALTNLANVYIVSYSIEHYSLYEFLQVFRENWIDTEWTLFYKFWLNAIVINTILFLVIRSLVHKKERMTLWRSLRVWLVFIAITSICSASISWGMLSTFRVNDILPDFYERFSIKTNMVGKRIGLPITLFVEAAKEKWMCQYKETSKLLGYFFEIPIKLPASDKVVRIGISNITNDRVVCDYTKISQVVKNDLDWFYVNKEGWGFVANMVKNDFEIKKDFWTTKEVVFGNNRYKLTLVKIEETE